MKELYLHPALAVVKTMPTDVIATSGLTLIANPDGDDDSGNLSDLFG